LEEAQLKKKIVLHGILMEKPHFLLEDGEKKRKSRVNDMKLCVVWTARRELYIQQQEYSSGCIAITPPELSSKKY